MSTLVVGDDTDLLALLCYHARLDKFYVYFRPEPKKGKGISKNYDIKEIKKLSEPMSAGLFSLCMPN